MQGQSMNLDINVENVLLAVYRKRLRNKIVRTQLFNHSIKTRLG